MSFARIHYDCEQYRFFLGSKCQRPEIARVSTTWLPSVPQLYLDVDQEKLLKQGIDLSDVYETSLHRCVQLNLTGKEAVSSYRVMAVLEDVFAKTMPREIGFAYKDMSYQEQQAQKGVPPAVIFAVSLLFVLLILAALYES